MLPFFTLKKKIVLLWCLKLSFKNCALLLSKKNKPIFYRFVFSTTQIFNLQLDLVRLYSTMEQIM